MFYYHWILLKWENYSRKTNWRGFAYLIYHIPLLFISKSNYENYNFFSKECQEKHLATTDEMPQYYNRKAFSAKYKLWRRQQRIKLWFRM